MSYEQIPGYSGFLPVYDQAVEEARDGAIFVEVGVALGHSIAYLARRVIDSGKRIAIYAVDPWAGEGRNGEQQQLADQEGGDFLLFLKMMTQHAPEELTRINVLRCTSAQASLMFAPRSVDMVLIDGPHDRASVLSDIHLWRPKMREWSLLAGDDHEPNYPGVESACLTAFGPAGYEVRGTSWVLRC